MTKCTLFLSGLFFLFFFSASAQNQGNSWIAIETDPISTTFGAKTFSVLVEPAQLPHWSLFVNVVSADFPDWMDDFLNPKNKGKGFDIKIGIGGGFAFDYFLKPERTGLYFGMINLFFQNDITLNNATKKILTHNVIPRAGYRWYPFSRTAFYLNPFFGFRYEYALEGALRIENQEFTPAGIQPFATLHIGYHF